MRSEDEIQALADKASDMLQDDPNRFSGMSYIEGVRAGLEWALEEEGSKTETPLE